MQGLGEVPSNGFKVFFSNKLIVFFMNGKTALVIFADAGFQSLITQNQKYMSGKPEIIVCHVF